MEVILVNDGSTDQSPQICDKYARKDDRIKVLHKENGGLSDARNVGLSYVTGEYVYFCDSDDYVDKDMLKKFRWNTRSFSAQFVNLLFSLPNKKTHIENQIKENCDYFPIWEKDPTVKSMLTMLQEIEKQYPGTELSNNLFSNKCKISI